MNNHNRNKLVQLIILVIVFVIGIGVGVNAVNRNQQVNIVGENELIEERPTNFANVNLSLFWTIWDEIKQSYVFADELEDKDLTYGAIKGLVKSIDDPYTEFLDPTESKLFHDSLNATLEGIGAELTLEEELITIVSPLKNSPAEKAGLRPGDIIYKINGDLATDYSLLDAIKMIRGAKGTPVTLTIVRKDREDPFDVTITRGEIDLESVTSENLGDGLFLISINQFSDDTLAEFLAATREAILANSKGLILDLRYNGGGYLETAVDILGEFLPTGAKAVTVESREQDRSQTLEVNGKGRLMKIPIAVLINDGSASASEILAGALQDYERAKLIGVQSFGKGTVQEVRDFADGSTLRLTIARWLTPKGRSINKTGLTPDQVVEITQADVDNKNDAQLEAAKKYLKSELSK